MDLLKTFTGEAGPRIRRGTVDWLVFVSLPVVALEIVAPILQKRVSGASMAEESAIRAASTF